MDSIKLPFAARLFFVLASIALIVFFFIEAQTVLIPLVFALLIAVLLFPVARWLEHRVHLGRGTSSLLCVLLFLVLLGGFFYFITLQVINFSHDLPQLQQKLAMVLNKLQHWIAIKYHINSAQQTAYLNKSSNSIFGAVANSLGNAFSSVFGILLFLVFVFIYTFFMLSHRRLLSNFSLHLFRPQHRARVSEVISETRSMVNAYVRGLLTEMIILCIVNCTVFLIMGIKYAILLGTMAAVLNIIPYIGIFTIMAVGSLVTFANGGGSEALGVLLTLFLVHLIDSNILMPRIVGSRVKMNALITIIAVLVGHLIWGIPGMFLFVPITGIIKIICERVPGLQAWAILIGTEDKLDLPPGKTAK